MIKYHYTENTARNRLFNFITDHRPSDSGFDSIIPSLPPVPEPSVTDHPAEKEERIEVVSATRRQYTRRYPVT